MYLHPAAGAGQTAEDAPRRIIVPVGLVRDEACRHEALRLDHALAAAKLASAGKHIVAHFVAVADQRQMHTERHCHVNWVWRAEAVWARMAG
jgi:hypothetical protein